MLGWRSQCTACIWLTRQPSPLALPHHHHHHHPSSSYPFTLQSTANPRALTLSCADPSLVYPLHSICLLLPLPWLPRSLQPLCSHQSADGEQTLHYPIHSIHRSSSTLSDSRRPTVSLKLLIFPLPFHRYSHPRRLCSPLRRASHHPLDKSRGGCNERPQHPLMTPHYSKMLPC